MAVPKPRPPPQVPIFHSQRGNLTMKDCLCEMLRVLLSVALLIGCLGHVTRGDDPPPRPNVLLILVDDMGYSDIGCFGGEIETPNLDRLAAEGMRLTGIHNTSKCFPSRACLLTGVYAQQCGMARSNAKILNAVTFGEVLRTAGYTTLWSGKHHGTENPYHRGFDHYAGLRDGACNHFNPGLPREGEPPPAQKRSFGKRTFCFDAKTVQPYTPPKDFYTTDAFTDWALDWLDEVAEGPADKPFLLFMAYTAPHDPMMARPDDIAKYEGVYDVGYEPIRRARYQKQIKTGLFDPANAPISPPEFPDWETMKPDARRDEIRRMQVYAAMIDRVDQNIGRLLDRLDKIGRLDNTLIVFVSDNGASSEVVRIGKGKIGEIDRWASQRGPWANVSNTPLRKYKNFSYEGGIRTPMIAWWPKRIAAGSISKFPGHFIDIMPTLVELSGAEYPDHFGGNRIVPMQGVSLVPVLTGKAAEREKPVFWQWSRGRAVRQGQWKLISQAGDRPKWELYDMEADRTELKDLASQYPDRVRSMATIWQEWYDSCAKVSSQ
jgi:arylsulfatase